MSRPQSIRGFTLVEMLVVLTIIGFIASTVFAALTATQLDARDKRRISDLHQIHNALALYYTKYNGYPREADGANGNITTNSVFQTLMRPYLAGTPVDPMGADNPTYFYYYDGNHNCGGKDVAVIFARQMSKSSNANYDEFFATTCSGVLDGEGRGGGEESYNLIIGNSSG